MTENELAQKVFSAGLRVHKELGPGLLESVYEECLFYEISQQKLIVQRQKPLSIKYGNVHLDAKLQVDLIVEDKLIVELKAVENISELHMAQLLTYLKMTNCKLGLLINFNTVLFKNGVRRIINGDLNN